MAWLSWDCSNTAQRVGSSWTKGCTLPGQPMVCKWNFLDTHDDQFMLWDDKISEHSMKIVTNSWPVSGSHVLSLCKSNHSQSKGPSGPLFYRKENPPFYRHGSKKIKYSNFIFKKIGTSFHRILLFLALFKFSFK